MTFTWINKQGVRSDDGFVAQFTGPFTLECRLGARVKVIDVEPGIGPDNISVPIQSFRNWDNSAVSNTPDEQAQLHKLFTAAMEFMARGDD